MISEKKLLGNGLRKIVLDPLWGNSQIKIRGLQLDRHEALDSFQKIGIFSLYSDKKDNNFKEGLFTTIYGLE